MTLSPETLAALADADLDATYVEALALSAVAEDLAGGVDVTSVATVPESLYGTAAFVPRAAGIVAGIPVAMAVLDAVGDVEFLMRATDGVHVDAGVAVLEVRGPVRTLFLDGTGHGITADAKRQEVASASRAFLAERFRAA